MRHPDNGTRQLGTRKHQLLRQMNYMLQALMKRGVRARQLLKHLKIKQDLSKYTTKELTGINSRLAEFMKSHITLIRG